MTSGICAFAENTLALLGQMATDLAMALLYTATEDTDTDNMALTLTLAMADADHVVISIPDTGAAQAAHAKTD